MAENESLDLGNPGGQRWNQVLDAIRKGLPAEEVARRVSQKFPQALAKAFKELHESGVSFKDLLENRHDSNVLERLVRKAKGHHYAHLFALTARMEAAGDDLRVVTSYLKGLVERVFDQIVPSVVGSDRWRSFSDVREFLGEVERHMGQEMRRISIKLTKDPTW